MKRKLRSAAIGFVVAMLIFTFLSRALSSVTTARVETQKAISGKISHSVTALGRVESGQEVSVAVSAQRTVEAVYIRKGDRIKEGDVLFLLSENQTLREAENRFLSWKWRALMALDEAADAYLGAFQGWENHLEKTNGWYWKNDADHEEDAYEKRMREAEYTCFQKYRDYLEKSTGWQEKAIENGTASDVQVKNAREKVYGACQELREARADYRAYQRGREKDYQYVRTEEETTLRDALEKTASEYETALQTYETELSEMERAIQDAQDGLSEDGMVYASYAGRVEEVNLRIGDQTTGAAGAVLSVESEEKTVTVTVSAGQEAYLEEGDAVTLKPYGGTDEIPGAQITAIQYDQDDPDLLDVSVSVKNDMLEIGNMVEVSFLKHSEQYGMLVPANAVYSGDGETYVLLAVETEGILGTVLEAKKVEVEILDRNSSYVAVSAAGIADQEMIVRSDREVKDGSRVRRFEVL